MMIPLVEPRFSVASDHSVTVSKARESTESTNIPIDADDVVRYSVLEAHVEESASQCSEALSHDSVCSSPNTLICLRADKRKSHASTEEVVAIQTCTNSLQFKHSSFPLRQRSASVSLPKSKSRDEEADDDADDAKVLWKFNFGRRGGMFPRTRKMPLREYHELEAEECGWNFSTKKREKKTDDVPKQLRTSVMLRFIPKHYTREDVLQVLKDHDFGEINFLYLLMNFKTGLNAGYCFINFRFPDDAREFKDSFTGHVFARGGKPEETAHVQWRYPIQGFASHVDLFKTSSVRLANLASQFQPMVIRDGKEVKLPQVRSVDCKSLKRVRKINRYMDCTNGPRTNE